LKVAINSSIINGPYGGGNSFIKNLYEFLKDNNHKIVFDLNDLDIDIILITEISQYTETFSFGINEIKFYRNFINKNVKIVHRINECDERKNTKNVNNVIMKFNKIADVSIFVSKWLQKLFESKNLYNSNVTIYSGSNRKEFFPEIAKQPNDKIKIITHHWGSHYNKGFDIYLHLDSLLEKELKNKVQFTYIGNVPSKIKFKNTEIISPKDSSKLQKIISSNDIYLTASINEPSGNHHIEGALCGLPILYINSGGIPEYCYSYGVMYNNKIDFVEKLNLLINNLDIYKKSIKKYPFDSEKMCIEYLKIFSQITSNQKYNKSITSKIVTIFYKIACNVKLLKNKVIN